MGLLLILAVVPSLQTARLGVDEDVANLLAGFKIMLSPDKHEVVRIVVYYMWCIEGEWNQKSVIWDMQNIHVSIWLNLNVMCSLSCSVLYLSDDPVWFGQPGYAHAVHGSASVCVREKNSAKAFFSLFSYFSILFPKVSKNRERASHPGSFIIMWWLTEELL